MDEQSWKYFLIKMAYWLGIAADIMWMVGLFFPGIFGMMTNNTYFNPDLQYRLIMGIGGILMGGWTILLIWAVRKPIERRFIILLTAMVVLALFIIALIGYLESNKGMWILIKNIILFILMIISYILSKTVKIKDKRG